jgi:hypothetical protein
VAGERAGDHEQEGRGARRRKIQRRSEAALLGDADGDRGPLALGLFFWRPWFAPLFTAGTRRLAVAAHVLIAFIMFVAIGIHVYAAIWTRGAMTGMIRGSVSRAWARFRYAGWYRHAEGEQREKPEQAT